MKKLKKLIMLSYRKLIKPVSRLNAPLYTKLISKHYSRHGMVFSGGLPYYLSPRIHFDGSDYSLIEIGEGTSISVDVEFLTHDFSANTVFRGLELKNQEELDRQFNKNGLLSLRKITVGKHTFIGAQTLILPGTVIGNNCLIGAGSVVRGHIPDNSIAFGNPCVPHKKTSEWLEAKRFGE